MKLLILIVYCLLFIVYPAPAFAQEPTPTPEPLDTSVHPSYGEDIDVTREVTKTGGAVDVSGQGIDVGVVQNEFKFPNLTREMQVSTNALPNLLPEGLLKNLSLPEATLSGKVFHPVCDIDAGGASVTGRIEGKGASDVRTPSYWTKLLGATKLNQASAVPGFSSRTNFSAPQPTLPLDEEGNKQLPDCPELTGQVGKQIVPAPSQNTTTISLAGVIGNIVDFFTGLWSKLLNASATIAVTVKPQKFLPGERAFLSQASKEETGFLRSFCPEEICPKGEGEQEETPYAVDGSSTTKELNFLGVAGARKGYVLLQQSLYPAELQPLRPIPETPPLPPSGGTGIFKLTGNPLSPQLEAQLRQASVAFNVPAGVLAAVAWIEGGHMWSFSDGQISTYSVPGGQDPINCESNGCGARGPMQFLNDGIAASCGNYTGQPMPDVWSSYANAVNEAAGENRTSNVCNVKDSVYAASKKLGASSGAIGAEWTQEEVSRAAESYYGECQTSFPRLGNRTYCEFVWENYNSP
ncbi:hypothetical protein HYV21_02700 [Candidatus Microgenomates bacterium]|nr:hypothetical protein [Candidatus Microgenomates bacterium]